jgi:hypothetical protein
MSRLKEPQSTELSLRHRDWRTASDTPSSRTARLVGLSSACSGQPVQCWLSSDSEAGQMQAFARARLHIGYPSPEK